MSILQETTPGNDGESAFPNAPAGWKADDAQRVASEDGLELSEDHWRLVRNLQAYFDRHADSTISIRELKDALEEAFHQQGGIRYLHRLCPGGPVAQGCRLAGLAVPPGAIDPSFGSVQ